MKKILEFVKKHKITAGIIFIVILAGAWYAKGKIWTSGGTLQYITSPVQKGMLTVSVSGTGQVEASNQIDIKPQTDGTITSVRVKENQKVKKGDIVAIIDQQTAANDVAKAKASLEQAEASYENLMSGPTSYELAAQDYSIKSAQRTLDQAKEDYENTITEQQQAVNRARITLFNSGLSAEQNDSNTTATLALSGSYSGSEEGKYTISLYYGGNGGLYYSVSGLGNESGAINRGTTQPLGNGLYGTFSSTGNLYSSTTWTINVPNAKYSSYQTNLISYNSAIDDQKIALKQAKDSITSAQDALDRANLQKQEILEPATNADISSAKASITSAKAQLQNAQDALNNTVLKAPFDGVIASLDVEAGDEANSGSSIATVITENRAVKITLNEVDAAKVKLGQKATVTFSSVSDLAISGTVTDVDNIGTVSQNVVSFSVMISLDVQDERIKPGMSASADIITDTKQDVLTVPIAAVKTANGQSYVLILASGTPEQINVTTGLSNDTDTEISGDNIKEGDKAVTQTVTVSDASSSSGAGIFGLFGGNRNRSTTSSSSASKSTGNVQIMEGGPPPGGF